MSEGITIAYAFNDPNDSLIAYLKCARDFTLPRPMRVGIISIADDHTRTENAEKSRRGRKKQAPPTVIVLDFCVGRLAFMRLRHPEAKTVRWLAYPVIDNRAYQATFEPICSGKWKISLRLLSNDKTLADRPHSISGGQS